MEEEFHFSFLLSCVFYQTTHFCGRPTPNAPTVDRRRSSLVVVVAAAVKLGTVKGDDDDAIAAAAGDGDDGSSDFIDRRADFPIARGPTLSATQSEKRRKIVKN